MQTPPNCPPHHRCYFGKPPLPLYTPATTITYTRSYARVLRTPSALFCQALGRDTITVSYSREL
jgi:hypothetical protein